MVYVCSVTRVDWVCHCCSCHILTSSVISCCTDSRQHEIELFHTIKKLKIVNRDVSMTLPSYKLIRKNQSERVRDAAYYTNAIGYHVPVQACICWQEDVTVQSQVFAIGTWKFTIWALMLVTWVQWKSK